MATTPFHPVKVFGFNRYNGGWTKSVTGLDKSQSSGYSIQGAFMRKDAFDIYEIGGVYLDCNISGSRKNQHHTYTLFRVLSAEEGEVLATDNTNTRNWAVNLWPAIEAALADGGNAVPSPLAAYSTEELIAELVSRGVTL